MASPENRALHTWGTEVATSANMNKLPRGWTWRAYNGAAQTISTTGASVDLTGVTTSVDVVANRLYLILASASLTAGVGTTSWIGEIIQDSTVIGRWGRESQMPAYSVRKSAGWAFATFASAATVTFKMAINTDVVVIVSGGGVNTAEITVVDIGSTT